MVMGSFPQLLRCKVSPLLRCYILWDSMPVNQAILIGLGEWDQMIALIDQKGVHGI